jgi:hypothetical protein
MIYIGLRDAQQTLLILRDRFLGLLRQLDQITFFKQNISYAARWRIAPNGCTPQ